MQSREEHLLEWNDALQDSLEGELPPAARARLDAHLESCEICRQQLVEFAQVDASLATALPRLTLDESFDRQLFAQIESSDEQARAARRRQAERQLQRERQTLDRNWRRNVVTIVPSVVAGIVLAASLSTYLGGSEFVHALIVDGAGGFGREAVNIAQLVVTSIIGAGIGLTVARWLARPG